MEKPAEGQEAGRKALGDYTAADLSEPQRTTYRGTLQSTVQDSQSSYDKTVVALSGGGLGFSLTMVDMLSKNNPVVGGAGWAVAAWVCWAASLTCALWSHAASVWANREALRLFDANSKFKEILELRSDKVVTALNIAAGSLFVLGAALMTGFVASNVGR